MSLSRCLAVMIFLVRMCPAQAPGLKQPVNRVTWVVGNLDKVRAAWARLGVSDIEEYPNIELAGQYGGQPVTTYAWQITGHLGNLTVDMIQPAEGHADAYTNFLSKHGDGIFSMVRAVPDRKAMEKEVMRMKARGVEVLQQVTVRRGQSIVTNTYFDTATEGGFSLGLVCGLAERPASGPVVVAHVSPMVKDAAGVSAYWTKLGFPAFSMQHAGPPHFGMVVDDLAKSIARYAKLGYHARESGRYVYIDTDSTGGVALELSKSAGGASSYR